MFKPTVFELRNYTLRKGGRARFESLFEREFVEAQEAVGSLVLGTFRVLDDPDRFVWIRCFETMESRAAALDRFYTSALWRQHRSAANVEIRASDNVLQLNRVAGDLPLDVSARAPIGTERPARAWFVVTTYFVAPDDLTEFACLCARSDLGGVVSFATDPRPNSYPRLPVRDDSVFVTVTRHTAPPDVAAPIPPEFEALMQALPNILRLEPTPRSLMQ